MKRICMVAYTNYLSDARPRREAETLARRGDQVDFIALAERNRPAMEMVQGVRLFRVKQFRYRGGSGLSYGLSYLRFMCAATLKLLLLFLKEKYEIVHFHTMPDLVVMAGLIPKLFGAKVVLDIHDMMPELYMSKFGIREDHALIRLLAWQEQFSIRVADKVICVHDPHREVLCRRGAMREKITVLPNVPDPLVFHWNGASPKEEATFRLVYHGTIARRLGLDLAVRAFAKATPSCPGARFEIFGEGDACDEVEAEIKASGVEDRIYFSRAAFSVDSIAQLIQGASVGLVSNRRDAATDYMLPVKMLEYVHLGIPVIAPRLMTIQYYFGDEDVMYYEPGEVDELAEAICQLYADPEKRKQLARKGREFGHSFCWEAFKGRLYKVMDDWPTSTAEAAAPDAEESSNTASTKSR